MGQVWRGRHAPSEVPVAIKIVSPDRARQERFRAAFRNEIQAAARLLHPGIVMLLDYGEINPEVEDLTDGKLLSGTPYLVMELLNGGSVADRPPPQSWADLRVVLFGVLDALAYAHARGVLHRDLSIRNVMWGNKDDIRPGLKLIDFGLASLEDRDTDNSRRLSAGTPAFQAPEQIAPWRARSQGPWTDLYAVGCMAYYLASGSLPFAGKTRKEVATKHLTEPAPPLNARIPVPDKLDDWLQRMLQKEPDRRFRSAADAAWNLVNIENERFKTPFHHVPVVPDSAEFTLETAEERPNQSTPLITLATMFEKGTGEPTPRPLPVVAPHLGKLRPIDPVPVPDHWQRPTPPPEPLQLLGAGLNLFGLRSIPLIGRETEREAIWRHLLAVADGGGGRAVLLRGPTGTGKTRLARWVAQRAHEVGCPAVMTARHEPRPGQSAGLVAMLSRHLKCLGLDNTGIGARVDEQFPQPLVLDPLDIRSLRELLCDTDSEKTEAASNVFRRPEERYELIIRVLRELTHDRFAVVVLDDIQWGADSLAFVQYLLSNIRRDQLPFLVVMTARDEALSEQASVSDALTEMMEGDFCHELHVGALDDESHYRLISGLLHLDDSLARQVQERTSGNPLFAVHLIDDWVRRGILEVRGNGFHLKEGAHVVFPDGLHEVWTGHIERLIEDAGWQTGMGADSISIALELAAALGQSVSHREWIAVCVDAQLQIFHQLIDLLVTGRLATRQGNEWSFAHGMVRESLERRADDAGRLADHHRRCARVLEARSGPRIAERLSRHHLAAGDKELAIPTLLEAAAARAVRGDYNVALEKLDEREAILEDLALAPGRVEWCEGWVAYARVHTRVQNNKEAEDFASKAIEVAKQRDWPRLQARALLWRARAANARGALSEGADWGLEGYAVAKKLGADELAAQLANTISNLYVTMARVDEAEEYSKETLRLAKDLKNRHLEAMAYASLGNIARHRGRHVEALALYSRTPPIFEQAGDAWHLALSTNNLADMARITGDLDVALEGYRKAYKLFSRISSESATWIGLNLALLFITQGDPMAARPYLERAQKTFGQIGQRHFAGITHLFFLPVYISEENWEAFDSSLELADRLLKETGMTDPDLAQAGEITAGLLEEVGEIARAKAVFRLAIAQWDALERPEQAERVRAIASKLD